MVADNSHNLPNYHGSLIVWQHRAKSSKKIFLPLPLCDADGISVLLTMIICYETPIPLSILDRLVEADLVIQCLTNADVDAAILAPSLVEDVASTNEGSSVPWQE